MDLHFCPNAAGTNSSAYENAMYQLDISAGIWTTLSARGSLSGPSPRMAMGFQGRDGRLFVHAGGTGEGLYVFQFLGFAACLTHRTDSVSGFFFLSLSRFSLGLLSPVPSRSCSFHHSCTLARSGHSIRCSSASELCCATSRLESLRKV